MQYGSPQALIELTSEGTAAALHHEPVISSKDEEACMDTVPSSAGFGGLPQEFTCKMLTDRMIRAYVTGCNMLQNSFS